MKEKIPVVRLSEKIMNYICPIKKLADRPLQQHGLSLLNENKA